MMETIGKYTIIAVMSLALTILACWLKSDYIENFFSSNAILVAGAIFAIHAASVGILLSQFEILKQRMELNFSRTIIEIRHSFKESILWLFIIMVTAIVSRGLCNEKCPLNFEYTQEICSFFVIFATIFIIIAS